MRSQTFGCPSPPLDATPLIHWLDPPLLKQTAFGYCAWTNGQNRFRHEPDISHVNTHKQTHTHWFYGSFLRMLTLHVSPLHRIARLHPSWSEYIPWLHVYTYIWDPLIFLAGPPALIYYVTSVSVEKDARFYDVKHCHPLSYTYSPLPLDSVFLQT